MPLMKMQHETDPKEELLKKFEEEVSRIHLLGASVLVAIYKRPQKTKGGILLTDTYRDEDKYQGTAGLILKMGPYPMNEEDKKYFGDRQLKIGDWVMFKVSDGMSFTLGSKDGDCRIFNDRRQIKLIIDSPDSVW